MNSDRRPTWDALMLASFNRGDATDRSYSNRTPTVGSGATSATRCWDFDGTSNAEVTYPDSVDFEAAPFTVAFWCRIDAATTARVNLIGKNDNSGNYPGWFIHWAPTTFGFLAATVTNSGSAYKVSYVSGTTGHNDTTWRHYAITCSDINSNVLMYINGVAQSVTTSNAGTVTTIASARPLTLGGLNFSIGHSSRLNGAIDDVRIYSRVLSAAELAAIHAETMGEPRP